VTKHTATNFVFAITVLGLLLLSARQHVSFSWYLLVLLLYILVTGLGSYFIELNFYTHSYCKGSGAKHAISLTFDDGPNEHTEQILDILKEQQTPATFFCICKNIKGNEAIIKRINNEGHLIGTHSFYHRWGFPLQSWKKIAAEITDSQKLLSSIIHKKPLLFRPPFGVTDPPIAKAIKQTKVTSIGWSVRSYDTVISSPNKLLERISRVKNGDIILFHDAGLQTKNILPKFIKHIRSQGFEIVPLDQLSGITAYEI
jgi:peptidoglycan/xylan/chitin deacetylase (PgdA/CDA1 family)